MKFDDVATFVFSAWLYVVVPAYLLWTVSFEVFDALTQNTGRGYGNEEI